MANIADFSHWTQVVQAYAARQIDRQTMGDILDQMLGVNWGLNNQTVADAVDRADAARNAAPAAPAAVGAVGSNLNDADIIEKYRSASYGPPGSRSAIDQAIVEISKLYIAQGIPQDRAFEIATTFFNRHVPSAVTTTPVPQLGPVVPTGTRPPANPIPAEPFAPEREFAILRSGTEAGRKDLFSRALAARMPGSTPWPVQQMLENQAVPYSDIFDITKSLGRIPEANTFSDFLNTEPLGRIDPKRLQGLVAEARNVLGSEPARGENENLAAFREKLSGDLGRQYQLATRASEPDIYQPLRNTWNAQARRNFNRFQLGQGLDQPEFRNSFLGFADKQGLTSAPATNSFSDLINRAAGVLSNGEAGLSDTVRSFRADLLNDPDQQFALALQAALPKVPAPLQNTFSDLAEREFRRFQQERGMFTPFLPEFSRRKFSFFGG